MQQNSVKSFDNFNVKSLDSWLNTIEQLPLNDKKLLPELRAILKIFDDWLNDKNVIQLTRILKKHGLEHKNSKLDEVIKEIRDKIFNYTTPKGRGLIHECAYAGNVETIQALTNLVSTNSINNLLESKSKSGETALGYAKRKGHQGVIAYLKLPEALLKKEIVCKKGADPKLEGLLLSMQALNLSIEHSFAYKNVTYHFTNCFLLEESVFGKRPLIFAFIEKSEKIYPRLFWLSQSQSMWRRTDKIFKDWIGKSNKGEEWLALPILINLKIFKILQKGFAPISNKTYVEEFLKRVVAWSDKGVQQPGWFLNPAGFLTNGNEKTAEGAESTDDTSSSSADVPKMPETHRGNILLGPEHLPEDPHLNDFINKQQRPDFSKSVESQIIDSRLYGRLKANVFLSCDRAIRFLFLQNHLNHVFLAGAELVEENVTIRGLKKNWVQLGSLSLPLLEYRDQFHDKFISDSEWDKISQGKQLTYVQTWNYLREMPCIQEYYSIPPKI
ncbi:ankyrin repeat domain-containing protein [Candidatus Protochlamydia amoebophila]|uniref:Uncharacterized protein n=1 Tax=Protochlamydia amoebophila (strain UWE25) TaxID=264201 RepID=Q6MBB0_PARUW|nr:ankyrin repeat domain-containing protein [Candidatus Protochlamydia amoebophila]CAF24139.1 unnamed protein product [Candidatus Protochlamydia amoebophila UWE25]